MSAMYNNFVCKYETELFESGYAGCEKNCDECNFYNNCGGCIGEQRSIPGEERFAACSYCEISKLKSGE